MTKPKTIELPDGANIPILYEDRSVLAIDKPAHWMLVPYSWQRTDRNLQAALVSSIAANDFWARSRGIKFLRFVHRLDAETTGVLLFARSHGAVDSYGRLFESRRIEKTYLVVVEGVPKQPEWTCQLELAPDPTRIGRMEVAMRGGKDAETQFRLIASAPSPGGCVRSLVEAHPLTGRTHQIRVHAAESGCPVVGDGLYGRSKTTGPKRFPLGLRAIALRFKDPFTRRPVSISAPTSEFLDAFGFAKIATASGWKFDCH